MVKDNWLTKKRPIKLIFQLFFWWKNFDEKQKGKTKLSAHVQKQL